MSLGDGCFADEMPRHIVDGELFALRSEWTKAQLAAVLFIRATNDLLRAMPASDMPPALRHALYARRSALREALRLATPYDGDVEVEE